MKGNNALYILGLVYIILCAVIWAGASVLIQYIYQDLDFQSPFFLTYLATSLLSLHLPVKWIQNYFSKKDNQQRENRANDDDSKLLGSIDYQLEDSNIIELEPESDFNILKLALIIAPVWFIANCLYNYSLLMTSVSSSTVISNLSASFTLAFSWWAGVEKINFFKALGILVCFAGAVGVGLQDEEEDGNKQTVSGDIIALLASAGYGVYTTLIRYHVPDEKNISMQLLLGYIGAVNAIVLLPVLLILIFIKIKEMQDLSPEIVGYIALNGFGDTVIADYFWAKAVVLTSPTVATIGMSITIPFALITDYFIHGDVATAVSIIGSILVIFGFILVNLEQEHVEQCKDFLNRRFFGYHQSRNLHEPVSNDEI